MTLIGQHMFHIDFAILLLYRHLKSQVCSDIIKQNREQETGDSLGRMSTEERQLPIDHFVSMIGEVFDLFLIMTGEDDGFAFIAQALQ